MSNNSSQDLDNVPCYYCSEPDIKLVSRATWVCQSCGKDNSLYFVMMADAVRREQDREDS